MDDLVIEELDRLLKGFNRARPQQEPEQTIFEIAGYPHYENVASNLIKFFLDPEENHKLKTVVLESLLAAAGITASAADLSEVTIQREAHIDAKGRSIDLLIQTASFVIAIENKLLAPLYNDFVKYAQFTRSEARESGKKAVLILLALENKETERDLAGFQRVTYTEFFGRLPPIQVMQALGIPHYLTYLEDFMRTVENLIKRPQMFKPVEKFIVKNMAVIIKLEGYLQQFREIIGRKLDDLAGQIKGDPEPTLHDVSRPGVYDQEWPNSLSLCRYWNIAIDDRVIAVEVWLSPQEWFVVAFQRPKLNISKLLVSKGFPPIHPDWGSGRSLCFRFPYDEDLGNIAEKVQSLINALRRKDDTMSDV